MQPLSFFARPGGQSPRLPIVDVEEELSLVPAVEPAVVPLVPAVEPLVPAVLPVLPGR
jgi:hypothetical protein